MSDTLPPVRVFACSDGYVSKEDARHLESLGCIVMWVRFRPDYPSVYEVGPLSSPETNIPSVLRLPAGEGEGEGAEHQ